jgi:carbonic anhydrase
VHQEWVGVGPGYTNGRRAVIAVLFQAGAENQELERLLQNLPAAGQWFPAIDRGGNRPFVEGLYYHNLLPRVGGQHADYGSFDKAAYRYTGSLTTPGCDEGITWMVLSTPVTASADQIRRLSAAMPANNARPVQALNGRAISTP